MRLSTVTKVSSIIITMTAATTINAFRTATATGAPRAAIVGGSLGGLASAHALQKTGWKVDIYERSPAELRNKGAGLGFVHTPSWEQLTERPMMRRNQRAHRAQGSFYYGDLWAHLYDSLQVSENEDEDNDNKFPVHFGNPITEIQGTIERPIVDDKPYDLVVVADGGHSELRKYVLGENKNAVPEYAGYVVWRGGISTNELPPQLLTDIRYLEGAYNSGPEFTIVLKMAKDNGEDMWTFGTIVATPESDLSQYWNKEKDGKSRRVSSHQSSIVPFWFLAHMRKHFGHIPELISLVEHVIEKGELKPYPQYEFGNIDTVYKGRVVLVGDAAHMASPRTAVGAHTGILDALALKEAMSTLRGNFSDQSIDAALQRYNRDGVMHAQQLYARSREVSQEYVHAKNLDKVVSPEIIYGPVDELQRS